MDKKKYVPESQDVTEPLPGMLDPISQARKDRADAETATKKEGKLLFENKMETMPAPVRKRKMSGSGMKKGGMVGSASKRADGCAQRGKTRGKIV